MISWFPPFLYAHGGELVALYMHIHVCTFLVSVMTFTMLHGGCRLFKTAVYHESCELSGVYTRAFCIFTQSNTKPAVDWYFPASSPLKPQTR